MKRLRKKSLLLLIVILLTTTFSGVMVNGQEDVEVSATYGFDSYVKFNKNMPVRVEVINNGSNFEGYIEIVVEREHQRNIAYRKEMSFPENSTREVTMYLPAISNMDRLQIEVKNHRDQLIKSNTLRLNGRRFVTDNLLIGILTEDYFNTLSYMNHEIVSDQMLFDTSLVELNSDELPEDVIGYEALDVIVINNYDTTRLDTRQYEALKAWVENGGTLIIGTGPTYSKTLAIFEDDFLSGEIRSSQTRETHLDLEGNDIITLDIQNIVFNEGEQYFDDLVTIMPKGAGSVAIALFDLGLEPMLSYQNNMLFSEELLKIAIPNTTLNANERIRYGGNSIWRLNDLLSIVPTENVPNMAFLLTIILIYIIIIAPIVYIVAKKLDKREWLWLIVPAFSVIFTGIIFLFGTGTRFTEPFVNRANIVTLKDDTSHMETYIAAISPNARDLEVEFPIEKSASLLVNDNNYYYGGMFGYRSAQSGEKDIITHTDTHTLINIEKTRAFSPNHMRMNERFDYEEDMLDIEVYYSGSGIEGTIYNALGYDLADVFIIYNTQLVKIGDVLQGANEVSGKFVSVYDPYSIRNEMYPNYYHNDRGDLSFEEQMNIRQRISIMELYFEQTGYNHYYNRSNTIQIIGFSHEEVISDIRINNKEAKEYRVSLISKEAPLAFKDLGEIELPIGFYSPELADPHSARVFYVDNFMLLEGNQEVELIYETKDNIELTSIAFKDRTPQVRNYYGYETFKGNIYIYNYVTGEYDEIQYRRETIEGEELQNYLDENEMIQIKLIADGDTSGAPMSLPLIDVKGRVQ
ncbi:hypothetical protein EDC19_1134 [Natranaerovirga hydrolytica]|uniref:Uncharacterized protein n=1 Tax=Natranaerovirga hydrolytica TaxID=680378 RepID=A0A4V2Q1S0_9FIRM|nr:hypothetical protein [Natranaerovirga hydrolytica]TCK98701.1 hypothetical protein EDC19_1134 [Natranaerovirga hydrolytica]